MGWENWESICKAMGIKLDKPKGRVIGKLGSVVWVYEELSKALWKINGQTFNLKFKKKNQLKFDLEYLWSSKQTSFNKQTKTLGYVHLFVCFSLALASQKINVLPLRKVIKIRFLFFLFFWVWKRVLRIIISSTGLKPVTQWVDRLHPYVLSGPGKV